MMITQLETRVVIRDNEPTHQAECPGCGNWADIDEEQLNNRVSLVCEECQWHGYIDGRLA